jgi:23S rRNA (cytosine1962-C5)-methyltransferase
MNHQQQYTLLDSGNFAKLEQLGPYRIVRPAAQAVWQPSLPAKEWQNVAAKFTRGSKGEGSWHTLEEKLPNSWALSIAGVSMEIRLTDFGHIGIFPEHHAAPRLQHTIKSFTASGKQFKLLNLFAYTGALTLLAAEWGAAVVHLDASRKSVAWARHNAELNQLSDKPIRWIVDDVKKFVAKEVRRGSVYDGIILDPPSFGRGTNNELWQIEDDLVPLLKELGQLRSKDFAFMQLSCHTPGYTPLVLRNLLSGLFPLQDLHADEMLVYEKSSGRPLPSGACCIYLAGEKP